VIFIANVLSMNGGTTFLTRICRRMDALGKRPAVLVMFDDMDAELHAELEKHAAVFYLWKYVPGFGRVLPSRLQTFGPINWRKLCDDLADYSDHIHVMGVFGLLFAHRLFGRVAGTPTLSVGVYHQNEFLYEPMGRRFPKEAQRIFRKVPSRNIVFFNDSTRENYESFFSDEYSESPIIPIGIDIRDYTPPNPRVPFRIVSVGNLVEFKTYNEHVIRMVAGLRGRFSDISYHIYGTGKTHDRLEGLVRELKVTGEVQIKGAIPYSEFDRVVGEASVFVGSGTALLEAAMLGVPALIGIESIEVPESYGFLCDIPNFSYNEYVAGQRKIRMADAIVNVFADKDFAAEIGAKCKAKAQEFSIDVTVEGLLNISDTSYTPRPFGICDLLLFSAWLAQTAVADKLWRSDAFGDRRNQSFAA
jgi:glycosyltransferase involved in cell wall biosynthesis